MARRRWKIFDILMSARNCVRWSAAHARKNASGCYDLAIASLRERHERGEVIPGEYGQRQATAEMVLHGFRADREHERAI